MRVVERSRNFRLDVWVLAALMFYVIVAPQWQQFKETRTYRDLAGITPFKDVEVFGTTLDGTGLLANGSMVKVRCDFDKDQGLTAYVTLENGLSYRFPVDTSVEDARGVVGNRPVSGKAEAWGVWKIWYNGGLGRAVSWEIHAPHIRCPGIPETQTNLFASGEWATSQQ